MLLGVTRYALPLDGVWKLIVRTKMKSERESKRLVSIGRIFLLLPKCECALGSDGDGG